MKRVAIVQSNYIPWKGYFDLMASVDEFVLYDDVQFTRRDWRNRNRIKTPNGLHWLSIPVEVKGKFSQTIQETRIADPGWGRQHWATIKHHYRAAPYFDYYAALFEELYLSESEEQLSLVNARFLQAIRGALQIHSRLTWSTDYSAAGKKSERLLSLCQQCGASEYLSGPSARAYLDEDLFASAGIKVSWMSYEGYPEYPQLNPPFEHRVSVIDLLLNTGPDAPRLYRRHI